MRKKSQNVTETIMTFYKLTYLELKVEIFCNLSPNIKKKKIWKQSCNPI